MKEATEERSRKSEVDLQDSRNAETQFRNVTSLFNEKLPDIPGGYNYDFVNADALVNDLSEKDNVITTSGGMSYRLLVLDVNNTDIYWVNNRSDRLVAARRKCIGD